MYFIVSTGRSGTTTIARLLSTINGCICLHEPDPQLILESSGYRYGTVAREVVREILLKTRTPTLNGEIYTESNQTLSFIIEILAEVFPQARFIWLMRNGLDVTASGFSKQWYTRHSTKMVPYEQCTPLQKAWIDGRIEGDRCGDVSTEEWQTLDRFGKCCWYWSYVNRTIEADLKTYAAGKYYSVRLETLDDDFGGLLKWMGLKAAIAPNAKRHNEGVYDPYHWSQWTDTDKKSFEYWCGNLMDRFYPGWRTPSGQWQAVPYHYRSGMLARLGNDYDFVKRVNRWLAPNVVV